MNPLHRPSTATAHAATAATPGKRSTGDSGPTRGRRGRPAGRERKSPTPLQTPMKVMIRRGQAKYGSSRVRARDRGEAVTEPRDAAKRGVGRIVDKPRSTNASDGGEVTDFRSRAPTERTRRECNTRKPGHQGTTSQIAPSP